ncbi:hypothetical protein MRX96_027832 [Rhipicephalus microplus]
MEPPFIVTSRFHKGDLDDLIVGLLIPGEVMSAQHVRVSDREALCMTLRPLAYPNRLCDLETIFNRHSFRDLKCGVQSIMKDTRLHENIVKVARGNKYVIYGDPTYPLKPLLLKPYGGARLQPYQAHFNKHCTAGC